MLKTLFNIVEARKKKLNYDVFLKVIFVRAIFLHPITNSDSMQGNAAQILFKVETLTFIMTLIDSLLSMCIFLFNIISKQSSDFFCCKNLICMFFFQINYKQNLSNLCCSNLIWYAASRDSTYRQLLCQIIFWLRQNKNCFKILCSKCNVAFTLRLIL